MEMPSFSYLQDVIEWLKGIIDTIVAALEGLTIKFNDYTPVEFPTFDEE